MLHIVQSVSRPGSRVQLVSVVIGRTISPPPPPNVLRREEGACRGKKERHNSDWNSRSRRSFSSQLSRGSYDAVFVVVLWFVVGRTAGVRV